MEPLKWNIKINFRDWSFGGAVHVLGNCQNIFDEHKVATNNAFLRYFTVQRDDGKFIQNLNGATVSVYYSINVDTN